MEINTSIKPGIEWKDVNGNKIEAHGGAIYFENGKYYWYGENKEFTDGKSEIWTYGIKCYSSTDFYNWKDEGYLVEPVLDDESSPLYPSKRVDRPHIIYNSLTKKYVMWLKLSGEDACFVILTCDKLTGKYALVNPTFRPHGKKSGDFDLFVSNGKGYIIFDADHSGLVCMELTENYLDITEEETYSFNGLFPPFVREAPCHFERDGKHYLFTSGMTGYIPNPSEVAVSDYPQGPYKLIGDPHIDDKSCASFNSQISCVFKHPEKDLYITLADRWVPYFEVNAEIYDRLKRSIASRFMPEKYSATPEEKKSLMTSPLLASANTSLAQYVVLPIEWANGKPEIRWHDEWRI